MSKEGKGKKMTVWPKVAISSRSSLSL